MRRRSKAGWVKLSIWVLVVFLAGSVCAQTATKPPVTTSPLSVDADPVPSPDPDSAVATPAPGEIAKPGEVVRSAAGKYTLVQDAFEVQLNASVLDGSGKPVDSLSKDAFKVYEDGVLQTINSFRHEDLPVSIGVLIDSSGSMYDKRSAVEAAAIKLIQLSNRQDEAFLVDFSSEAYIDQDFTNDIAKLQQGLSYIKSSGGTAIYDALIASADYLSKNSKRPKQVLLIVTDGEDNASSATLEQAIQRIQDLDGPAIYCIGLLFGEGTDRREARHAKEVLSELSEQTGGLAYFPHSLKDVDGIAAEVAQDIRTQYTIAYRSTKSPKLGGYRQVHVEAREKGYRGLQVRTRTGYFPKTNAAPPSDPGQ